MVVDLKRHRVDLCYPTGSGVTKTGISRIEYEEDPLPCDSCFFSGKAARTAAALSLSAGDEKMLKENLTTLGYSDILFVALHNTDSDKIGMCLSTRRKDDGIEVAVILCGTSGDEWYSNFDIGYSAEHKGFSKAADFAELKLGDYVFTRAIGTEPDFFVAGYSRGGAVANILAKRLCDRYGTNHVWAYTFGAPSTTISRRVARYNSIFNLTREEDFFTRVPLVGWGYTKYGRLISLSDIGDITARFKELCGDDYIGFTRKAAVDNFLCAVRKLAPNVHAYYERRRNVGGRRLSLYEFMRSVADMLSNHMDDAVADVFFSAMLSEYADLISFLSSGADLGELIASAEAVPRCSVADSHSPAAYIAALDVFLAN